MSRSICTLICAASFGLVGCGTDTSTGDRPLFLRGANNLTIIIYDGISGAAVDTADVRLQVGPHVLTATNDGQVYSVTQIPKGDYVAFVEAPGYLSAAAPITFNADGLITDKNTVAEYLTRIAVMYPIDSAEQDIVVRVYDSSDATSITTGKMVATLDRDANFDFLLGGEVDNDLILGTGLRPTSIAIDVGTDGTAVIPKNQLVLGLTYDINIYGALDANSNPLVPVQDRQIQAGFDFPELVVFMAPPTKTPVVLSVNNEDGGNDTTLEVTFPHAMAVCSDPANHTWWDPWGNDRSGGGATPTNPDSTEPVIVTLSADKTVLTAAYQANPEDVSDALSVQFSGIRVQVEGTSNCTRLDQLQLRDSGGWISTTITVR